MNAPRPRIAIDAMGGDGGAAVTVPGALALADVADLLFLGDANAIRELLSTCAGQFTPAGVQVIHASEQIETGADLRTALRHRPDASMRRALELLGAGRADAVVSAGDTAALMALSRQCLSTQPGVRRPAICKAMMGAVGPFWMLDLGANLECDAQELHQFARLGSTLASGVGGLAAPRVALLNVGTESAKGPAHIRAAAETLRADTALNFVGYIEANRLFRGEADVVVADGFAGNVALKAMEGAAWMAGHMLRRWFEGLGFIEQAALALARSKIEGLRHELNPERYNGASFVGLTGVVVKSHGGADREGFASAVRAAIQEVRAVSGGR
ncbi:MAG: phosphate acyltransferase PlsX [Pseudomonadales bacterium]